MLDDEFGFSRGLFARGSIVEAGFFDAGQEKDNHSSFTFGNGSKKDPLFDRGKPPYRFGNFVRRTHFGAAGEGSPGSFGKIAAFQRKKTGAVACAMFVMRVCFQETG